MQSDQNKEKKLRILSREEAKGELMNLIQMHHSSLHLYAAGLNKRSRIESDELLQEFYYRVFKNPELVLESYVKHQFPCFARIMYNTCIDLIRKRNSLRNLSNTIAEIWMKDEQRRITSLGEFMIEEISKFINRTFPHKKAEVLKLFLFDGYSYNDIAEELKLNVNNVATIIRRGRIIIQDYLRRVYN